LNAVFAGPVREALDFCAPFAFSSYDATLKRSGLPPSWLPIFVRNLQSRRGDTTRRAAIAGVDGQQSRSAEF
jgi:hypothetical protein